MKDISVSIITYNRKDILRRVIKSLEEQTYPPDRFEVVIVDDGSKDGTREMCENLAGTLPLNIRYYHEDHPGKCAVRNLSIERAGSDLILFIEDDTIADRRLVEEHVMAHRAAADPSLAVVGYGYIDKGSMFTPFAGYIDHAAGEFFKKLHERIENGGPDLFRSFCAFNLSIGRDFLLRNGMFDSRFDLFSEDIELGYRLLRKGLKIKGNKKAIVYDAHPISLEGACRRNTVRGYVTVLFERTHPGSFGTAIERSPVFLAAKSFFYPALLKASGALDRAGVGLPYIVYRKLLEFHLEKGIREGLGDR